jgi:hypothetical protein
MAPKMGLLVCFGMDVYAWLRTREEGPCDYCDRLHTYVRGVLERHCSVGERESSRANVMSSGVDAVSKGDRVK